MKIPFGVQVIAEPPEGHGQVTGIHGMFHIQDHFYSLYDRSGRDLRMKGGNMSNPVFLNRDYKTGNILQEQGGIDGGQFGERLFQFFFDRGCILVYR